MKGTIDDKFVIIKEKLEKAGYRIRRSPRFRELLKFDELYGHVFNLFYENPFLRLIFQHFLAGPNVSDVTTILTEFKENRKIIEEILPVMPLCIDVCPNCGDSNFIRKKIYGNNIYYCKSCKQQFEFPVKKPSLSELGNFDMYRFLMDLVKAGVLTRGYQLVCYRCGKMDVLYKYDDAKNIVCQNCGEVRELSHIFSLVEPPRDIRNLDSIWLEWYVYKLLKEKCQNLVVSALPVHKVVGDDFETEVDLLVIMKNGKLLSLDCKAKHFRKTLSKDDIDPNILNWNKFSDMVGIVTTSRISDQCIQFWEERLKKPIFVDGGKLEEINRILKLKG